MTRPLLAVMLSLCASPVFAQPDDWTYRSRDGGVHLRILRDYHLAAGATAHEPIVVIGGSATIDGRADGDVVVFGGTLRVGPGASVRGNVAAVGGEVLVDPGAQVAGDIDEVSVIGPDFDRMWARLGTGWWAVAAFGATLMRLALAFVVTLLLTVIAPGWVVAIAHRGASAGGSVLLGITGQLLFIPVLVVISVALLISIVGIPLLAGVPLLAGAAAIMWSAGFAAVAVRLGHRLRGIGAPSSPVVDLFTGFTAIAGVTLLAHSLALGPSWMTPLALVTGAAGLIIEYVAWTIGLGAAIAWLFGRPYNTQPSMPPLHTPVPAR